VLSLAKRAVPDFISWVLMLVVISRVSMYSLVLFFTSYTCTTAAQNAGLGQGAGHRFGDHLQVGGTEFVGHGFNRFGVAVADVLAAQGRRGVGATGGQQGEERSGKSVQTWGCSLIQE
jgi:hypothetical protein